MTARRLVGWAVVAIVVTGVAIALWIARPHIISISHQVEDPHIRLGIAFEDGAQRVEIGAGTPIVLEIALTTRDPQTAETIGGQSAPWTSMVRLVGAGARSPEPLNWDAKPVGKPQSLRFETAADGRPQMVEDTTQPAVVDRHHFHRTTLGIAPEVTAKLAPGVYELRAVLDTGRRTLTSEPVAVVVSAPTETAARGRLERDRLAASASFYLQVQQPGAARPLAEQLSRLTPENPGAWVMLGDALSAGNQPREALAAYRHALEVAPRTYEEPTELYDRMAAARRKLRTNGRSSK